MATKKCQLKHPFRGLQMSGEAATSCDWGVLAGQVTQVVDPHCFWMQIWTSESLAVVEQFQEQLGQFCSKSFNPVSSSEALEGGQLVLVDCHPQDGPRWRRGLIARVMDSENCADIFFVDYGNTETCGVEDVCSSFPDSFKSLPPQAVRCALAGVNPIGRNWTTRGTKTFQRLAGDGVLHVVIINCDPISNFFEVVLYPSDEDNGQSISHSLLEEEVAMQGSLVANKEVEKAAPVTPPKAPPASSEKYIPPHVKNPGALSGALPPGYDQPQAPAAGYVKQSSPGQGSANKNGKPSPYGGYGKQNSGYNQNYSHDYGKHVSVYSNNHQNSPPGSRNVHQSGFRQQSSGYYRSPTKTSPGVDLKEKEPVNDFFPFQTVSVYPPSSGSPLKSPVKGPRENAQGPTNSSYFPPSPSKYSNNNHGYGDNYQNGRQSSGDIAKNNGYNDSYSNRSPDKRFAKFNSHSPASNTFEPSFMAQQADERHSSPNQSKHLRSRASPFSSPEKEDSPRPRPRLNIEAANSPAPFYPPRFTHHHHNAAMENLPSHHQPGPAQRMKLLPPDFYQSQAPPSLSSQAQPSLTPPDQFQAARSHSQSKEYGSTYDREDTREFSNKSDYSYSDNYAHGTEHYSQQWQQSPNGNKINSNNISSVSDYPAKEVRKVSSSRNAVIYERQDSQGRTVEKSPDTPYIEGFNFSELDHTHMITKEAAMVEKETAEQSALVNLARFGNRQSHSDTEPCDDAELEPDIVDEIANEIRYTTQYRTKELEELRRSPVKKAGQPAERDVPNKLEGIPASYISDIDFSEAVREALLDSIFESLRNVNSEKQLYDVLLLLLAYAIHDLEIKEILMRALKRQQELCITERKCGTSLPQNCAQVMGHIYGQQLGQQGKEGMFLDCFTAFWEVAGHLLFHHNTSFQARIRTDMRHKILNENVDRERLLEEVYLTMFSPRPQAAHMATQTNRITSIPSSCQVKPCTTDAEGSSRDEQDTDHVTSSTPEPKVSLRPRGRGRRFSNVTTENPGDKGDSRPESPLTHADLSMNNASMNSASFMSATSDSIYHTPDETMSKDRNNENLRDKSFSARGDLTSAFKENAESENHGDTSVITSTHRSSQFGCDSSGGSRTRSKDSARKFVPCSSDKGRDNETGSAKSIVDWFDYVPSADRGGVTSEEKKLKTKKKLDSASMSLIEHEDPLSKLDLKDKKKKKEKEVKKGKTEETVRHVKENPSNKFETADAKSTVSSTKSDALHDKSRSEKHKKKPANEMHVNSDEDWEKGYSNDSASVKTVGDRDTVVVDEKKDWWGDEVALEPAVIQGVSGSCEIYNDLGPDVIIEGEFEQDIVDNKVEDFADSADDKLSSRGSTTGLESSETASIGSRGRGRGRGKRRDSQEDSVVITIPANPTGKDEYAFEVEGEWESDFEDDFDNNGQVDEAYEKEFPSADLHAAVRAKDTKPVGANLTTSNNTSGITLERDIYARTSVDQESSRSRSLADFIPGVATTAEESRPPRPRWTPGPRRCLACHQLDHTTDVCPNKKIILL
ncbi:TDRD5-like protein [Mya arenaria]|uniref:TDRD5-like protein n=1 Tax=Mya arenaria TaxID=6604 RepID=A0ABY7FGU9_MYAAR|nr:TDRD5-like protein [Mya arenaria]